MVAATARNGVVGDRGFIYKPGSGWYWCFGFPLIRQLFSICRNSEDLSVVHDMHARDAPT